MIFDREKFNDLYEYLNGASIAHVWLAISPENLGGGEMTFDEKKIFFLSFLSILLHEGKIKIGKKGRILDGTVGKQIEQFRSKMPKNELTWKDVYDGFWFFDDECPGGIVWISESGYEDWT